MFFGKDKVKIFKLQNGLGDKILNLYDQRDSISLDETAQYADNLYYSRVKNLKHKQSIIPLTKRRYSDSWQKKLLLLTQNKVSTKMMPNPPKTFQRLQQCCLLSDITLTTY